MNKEELRKEKELVKKAKRNKKDFSALYEKYSDKIRNFIMKKVNNDYIAEDITSKVFEKALKNLDSYQWQGVSFGSWLYRIARNTVYDYYRTNKANRREDLEEEVIESGYDPDETVIRDEREVKEGWEKYSSSWKLYNKNCLENVSIEELLKMKKDDSAVTYATPVPFEILCNPDFM